MNDAPEEPGDETAEVKIAKISDRRFAPDCRHRAKVAISERPRHGPTTDARGNDAPHISALLFGDWGNAGQRLPVGCFDKCCVANNENLRVALEREIALDYDVSGAVLFGSAVRDGWLSRQRRDLQVTLDH